MDSTTLVEPHPMVEVATPGCMPEMHELSRLGRLQFQARHTLPTMAAGIKATPLTLPLHPNIFLIRTGDTQLKGGFINLLFPTQQQLSLAPNIRQGQSEVYMHQATPRTLM
jgi:hypothetical protein